MKPTIVLTFANCEQAHLSLLKSESSQLNHILSPLHDKGAIEVFREESTSIQDLTNIFNRFDQRMCLFHYAGHAGKEALQLEDQLADAMVQLSSAVKAGLSLAQALDILAPG